MQGAKFHDRLLAKSLLPLIPSWVEPNHITIVRFFLTPAVVAVTIWGQYLIALPFFLAVAFTDILDGSLARVRNRVTTWGKVFDPVADKLLIGSLVVVLVAKHLDVGLALLIVSLELLFMLIGLYKLQQGTPVQANRWGKIKMSLQVLGVTLLFVGLMTGFTGFYAVSERVLYVAIAFAVVSLFAAGI